VKGSSIIRAMGKTDQKSYLYIQVQTAAEPNMRRFDSLEFGGRPLYVGNFLGDGFQ
jgi:hypothetical protein